MLFMTVPTAGSHPELLDSMIRDCGLPRENIVIIATAPGVAVPEGCVVIEDFGPKNIQRWWSTGIEESKARGAAGARSRLHVGRPDAQLVARRRALVAPDEREALGRLHLELEV